MNKTLEKFAREQLKAGLKQCTDAQNLVFKHMYSHKNLDRPLDDVVDAIPVEKLDWAMQQIERTVAINVARGDQP